MFFLTLINLALLASVVVIVRDIRKAQAQLNTVRRELEELRVTNVNVLSRVARP